MTVSFDGLRIQLISNYNRLCLKLKDAEFSANSPYDKSDIENEMQNIREIIVILGCMYKEGEYDFIENLNVESFSDYITS